MAHFEYKTKVPTVNLDNFKQITAIDCSTNSIVLSFVDSDEASEAETTWALSNNLA